MGLAALQVGAASSVVVQRAGDARGWPAVESSVPWCAATAMPDWDSRRAIEKGRSPSPVPLVARSRHRGAVFNVHRPCRPRCDLQWCGRITLIGAPGGALSSANVGLDGIESSLASPLRVASARGCLSAGSAVGCARAQGSFGMEGSPITRQCSGLAINTVGVDRPRLRAADRPRSATGS